jgi:ankyrin repeat protein
MMFLVGVYFSLQNGETPLMTACTFGHITVIESLLAKDASLDLADKVGTTLFVSFHTST